MTDKRGNAVDNAEPAAGVARVRRSGLELDPIDVGIVNELREDGRRSYNRIAQTVGLSEAATRQRVQRLVANGLIKIIAVPDQVLSKFQLRATVGLRTDGDMLIIADAAAAIPEVDFVVITAGSFDLLLEISCDDDSHLLSVLNDHIRTIPGVRGAEAFIYLRMHKQSYPWPPGGDAGSGTTKDGK